jgi:uncharacterized membrane protein
MKKNSLPARLAILKLVYLDVVVAYRNCSFEMILSIDLYFKRARILSIFAATKSVYR